METDGRRETDSKDSLCLRPAKNRGQDVPTIERWLALKGLGENRVLGRLWDRQAYACAPLPDPGGASH